MAEKKLYRKREGQWVAGVCTGLADYMEIDAALVRVLVFILCGITGGVGIVAYLILAMSTKYERGY